MPLPFAAAPVALLASEGLASPEAAVEALATPLLSAALAPMLTPFPAAQDAVLNGTASASP